MSNEITDDMLWGLAVTEDNKVSITIFEAGKVATIKLDADVTKHFATEIIRYAQLLSK